MIRFTALLTAFLMLAFSGCNNSNKKNMNIYFEINEFSDHNFSLIMGADNLDSFHKWKNAGEYRENDKKKT